VLEAKLRSHVTKAHGEALAAMTSLPSNAASSNAAAELATAGKGCAAADEAGSDDE
jgi:hypothetical protein